MNVTSGYSLSNPQFVEANRRGEIDPGQRVELNRAAGWLAGCSGLVLTLVLLPAILAGVLVFITYMDTRHETPPLVYGGIVAVFGIILLAAATPQALAARRTAALRRGLAAGRVEPAEGEVRWDGRRYRAEAAGRRLRSPFREINLPPGRYRFYVLPDTDALISGEAIPGAEASEGGLSFLSTLAGVHKFQIDALEANRQGRLAGSQSARLALALAGRLLTIPVVIVVAVAVWWFVLRDSGGQSSIGLLVAAAVAAGLSLYALWQSLWLGLDLMSAQVMMVEGPVERRVSYSGDSDGRTARYYYSVHEMRFRVSSRAYGVLIPGLTYRVYYTPRSRRLVAIEPV